MQEFSCKKCNMVINILKKIKHKKIKSKALLLILGKSNNHRQANWASPGCKQGDPPAKIH